MAVEDAGAGGIVADCVRGCATPHDCTNCLAGRAEHPPVPSPAAKSSRLCRRCERRLDQVLRELERTLPELYEPAALQVQHTGEREGSFRSKGAMGSPALIRLDVLAMISPESRADETGLTHIAGEISSWVRALAGFVGEAGTLLGLWDDLIKWDRIGECFEALDLLHRHVMRAVGETSEARPLGRCLSEWDTPTETPEVTEHVECGATVWAMPGDTNVRCRRCGRVYDPLGQVRLKHQSELRHQTETPDA